MWCGIAVYWAIYREYWGQNSKYVETLLNYKNNSNSFHFWLARIRKRCRDVGKCTWRIVLYGGCYYGCAFATSLCYSVVLGPSMPKQYWIIKILPILSIFAGQNSKDTQTSIGAHGQFYCTRVVNNVCVFQPGYVMLGCLAHVLERTWLAIINNYSLVWKEYS